MNEHDDLRRLLEHAVDDVEPRDALGSIQARTKVTPMTPRKNWVFGAGAAVVATAATVLAIAVVGGDGGGTEEPGFAGPSAAATTPPTTTSPSPTASAGPDPATSAVPVYYVGDTSRGPKLYREFHRLPDDGNAVLAAVTEAVTTPPTDPDYRTDWPVGTTVPGAGIQETDQDRELVVLLRNDTTDLRTRPIGMTPEEAQASVEQLIYTAQAAAQSRFPVQFLLEREGRSDQRTDTLLGVPVAEPLANGDPADVLAQVWVIDPAEGAEVTAPFEVNGLAAAFEATVVWELRSGDTVVADGYTAAEECCKMEPYSFEVDAPPGEYTLVVQDTDPSGGEGYGVWEDTKQVTVLP